MPTNVNSILNDDRKIQALYWPHESSRHKVGETCDEIIAYPEPGQHAHVPFFAVKKFGQIILRVPAHFVEVQYEEPTPDGVVKLTYFKASGKYYTSGEYITDANAPMFELYRELIRKQKANSLPGVLHPSQFFIYVQPSSTFEHPVPALIFPVVGEEI